MKNKKNKGFSVIEIVLVLGVIGILSSFIVPKVRDYLAMAKDSKAINTLQSLRMANETYFLENGNYPKSDNDDLVAILESLNKYIGNDHLISNGQLDIGGSKNDQQDIKYGGKINVELDDIKGFKFVPIDGDYKYNTRGDEWSNL
ncbi:type II secretion system protein [Candidatus Cetobacterium colombiensis]|uniref:Type II secretion system protein n=1 Tax=Candidatus Cetobacterium colombiensis TaxID=3073100 RepID=A0ABU4WCH9_9FUSO|nr:type II secretion system protein [Candidatus Cetobacterium colombiensis]MDX8336742.1 type II secretion system protein [Candidatus Cetobacterium colombiensis]